MKHAPKAAIPQDAPAPSACAAAREGMFEAMFRGHVSAMFLLDPDTMQVLDANQSALDFYGWKQGALGGITLASFCMNGAACHEATSSVCRSAGGRVAVCKHRLGTGEIRDVDLRVSRIRTDQGEVLFAVVSDISGRTQAEQALRDSEARFRSISESVMEGIFQASPEGGFQWVNPAFARMLGYASPADAAGRTCVMLNPPVEAGEGFGGFLARAAARGDRREVRLQREDGLPIWVSVHVWAQRGEGGRVLRYEGVAEDVTARRQAEAERMLLVAAVEQAVEGIAVTGAKWSVEYVNPAFSAVTGLGRSEALGRPLFGLFLGARPPLPGQEIAAALAEGREWTGIINQVRPGGHCFTAETTFSPIRDASGQVSNAVLHLRDVSYQERLEKRLRRAQKLEAVGTLAGGIAHDFNNILTPILLNAELGMQLLEPGDILRKPLEDIIKAGGRARQLIKQILAFSRRGSLRSTRLALAPLVRETIELMRPTLPADVEATFDEGPEPLSVMADPSLVHQMLSNLMDNALHAMRGRGGSLSVALARHEAHGGDPSGDTALAPGEYALLTVGDTGHGMDASLLEKIFVPFFTTKRPGEGTGMGLATVHGIVRSLGGAVRAESELGRGSLFRVYLPLAPQQAGAAPSPGCSAGAATGAVGRRALVVDAQAFSRQALAMTLREIGFKVTSMRDASKALDVFARVPARFDAVLAGENLHGMSGWEFLAACRRVREQARLVLLTDQAEDGPGAAVADAVLAKPVSRSQLARALGQPLDAGGSPPCRVAGRGSP
ncbi:PAS domain-containing hybrid sensor histidine kinase/response regulator [Fundidesulfovibrio soli]|uniref:PAS domain-containing hybrid sensor histidine kinase/response regulator n=1 Tax=Fundidesulfovibrio soli TaxID=2922716 RepID=UPI001FAF82DC|nr:PAS domain S-box protein [Fundidesulfovibrio soli]